MSAGGGSVTPAPPVGPTSSACLEELLARGVAAVRQAAAFALDPGEELRIEAKAHRNDLVTQVDRGVEERIAGHLEATGVPIHGEEAHRVEDFETYRGRAWVLDPIDGTLNYVATHRDWAISLALVDDGVPTLAVLADPVAGRLYTAIRGRGAWVQPLLVGSAGADDAAPRALGWVEDLPLSEGMLIAHFQLCRTRASGGPLRSRAACAATGRPPWRWRRWLRAARSSTPSRGSSPGTLRPVRCCVPRPARSLPGWTGRPSTCAALALSSWAPRPPTPRRWGICAPSATEACRGGPGARPRAFVPC